MKLKFLALLLSFSCLMTMADEPKTHFVVWSKDGTLVAFALEEKPEVTFTVTDIVISSNDIKVNYPLDNLSRFTYEDNDFITAITNLQTDKTSVKQDGEFLLFPALKACSVVSIYSINGTLIFCKSIQTAGDYSFPLSNLSKGSYIVSVNGVTYKFVKR